MEFGWKIVVGSIIGFCGAAFGSVGGVGGGGIFVPMLTLVIGFDPKSATAISKCKWNGIIGKLSSVELTNLSACYLFRLQKSSDFGEKLYFCPSLPLID